MKDTSNLDAEILASFDRDEWKSVHDTTKEAERYAGYAIAALAKDKRVNIRISSRDLEDIQAKAAQEGLPYQSLMSSVLHKYVTGRLVDAQALEPSRKPASKKRAG